MNYLTLKCLFFLAVPPGILAQTVTVQDILTKSSSAIELNIARADRDRSSLQASIRTMGMDLQLGYEIMDPLNPDMQTHKFSLKQELTGLFKNSSLADQAKFETEARSLALVEKENDLKARVNMSLIELFSLRKGIALKEQTYSLLKQIQSLAQVKFATGNLSLVEWNQLEVNINRVLNEKTEMEAWEIGLTAEILGQVNWPGTQAVIEPFVLKAPLKSLTPVLELLQTTLSYWPGWAMLLKEAQSVEAEKNATIGSYLPDLMVEASWSFKAGQPQQGQLGLGVGISLPTFSLAARSAMLTSNQLEANTVALKREAETSRLLRYFQSTRAKLTGIQTTSLNLESVMIPLQSKTSSILLESYRVGKADFADLLESFMSNYDLQEQLIAKQKEALAILIEWEFYTGKSFLSFHNEESRSQE